MKCQQCEKPATFHITELTGDAPQEIHLCEDHAREYLSDSGETPPTASLAGALAQQLKIGQTAEELARLDQQACPVCGITFYEFRNQGRLGCPHDYECFAGDLEPLIVNIHGATEHKGKRPKHPVLGVIPTDLIRLRREMLQAVASEQYEEASRLRDRIRSVEKKLKKQG
jgi:protein arginine kinase activator